MSDRLSNAFLENSGNGEGGNGDANNNNNNNNNNNDTDNTFGGKEPTGDTAVYAVAGVAAVAAIAGTISGISAAFTSIPRRSPFLICKTSPSIDIFQV